MQYLFLSEEFYFKFTYVFNICLHYLEKQRYNQTMEGLKISAVELSDAGNYLATIDNITHHSLTIAVVVNGL